jgi:UDP-N-acetylenolpyruvoylglucosamine reductase
MDTTVLDKNAISFQKNVSLKTKTWIKRGGIAKFWITPDTVEQLSLLVKYFYAKNIYFEIVGYTSNIYFSENYNPTIVISTKNINQFTDDIDKITCDCGVNMKILSEYCVRKGYEGFEGLIDLPGTVAAAAYNNSSCFNCSISNLLIALDYLDKNGKFLTLSSEQMEFSHRSSIFKSKKIEGIILRVHLKKLKGDNQILSKIANKNRLYRKMYQEPPKQNLGSTYATIPYKVLPLFIVLIINKLCSVLKIDNRVKRKLTKYSILIIFNFRGGYRYVSDYNIGCFVWRDEKADEAFIKYRSFMERISKFPQLEIEIKQNIKFTC